ncbi:tail fiber domain-containing protein [Paracrocinitomix mangrovi]|uniref:tail fiber domain-containing protein n=1 Tax=Paracrocinitomix mangrovi TaxID=2862509 RepID=UPI001C8EE788|nr:tail fiber domain-containing protein [Paracrocinitomix mangrovi]UKN02745.1 tail fiber domain-containing protein [Paracrocinitomix mangrovi]
MKTKFYILAIFFAIAHFGFAQAPEAFNYQAVARDGAGNLLSSQSLDVKIGIYSGSGAATLEYEETHAITTNQYGQFSLQVGTGTVSSGTFSSIGWGTNEHHLKVEIDLGGGYVDLGTAQLMSVPYALHALSAGPWLENGTAVYYNGGYVGINTASPALSLHIKQTVSNKAIRVEHQTTTDYWEHGIGVNTHNYKFIFNGLGRADIASADGAYIQTSDRRLKHDIVDLEPVLGKIMQLKPSSYYYNGNKADDKRSYGFVAQDVEPLFPDLVRDIENGYSGIVYDGFAVVSIKAIQELNDEVENLKKEMAELKALIKEK